MCPEKFSLASYYQLLASKQFSNVIAFSFRRQNSRSFAMYSLLLPVPVPLLRKKNENARLFRRKTFTIPPSFYGPGELFRIILFTHLLFCEIKFTRS
jgi:hypothetical protein